MRHLIVAVLAGGFALPAAAASAPMEKMVTVTPSEIKWQPAPASMPSGAEVAMLEGDMTRKEFFVMRIKMPAGFRVPAHWHPGSEHVTVIEGTFLLGQGDKFDEQALLSYPAGSYFSMTPKMKHFAMTKDGAVIQLSGTGPWGITYVDPQDDPRKQARR